MVRAGGKLIQYQGGQPQTKRRCNGHHGTHAGTRRETRDVFRGQPADGLRRIHCRDIEPLRLALGTALRETVLRAEFTTQSANQRIRLNGRNVCHVNLPRITASGAAAACQSEDVILVTPGDQSRFRLQRIDGINQGI